MDFRELAAKYGLSHRAFARRFGIPYRTVENWSSGERVPPGYVVSMAAEILEHDARKKKKRGE